MPGSTLEFDGKTASAADPFPTGDATLASKIDQLNVLLGGASPSGSMSDKQDVANQTLAAIKALAADSRAYSEAMYDVLVAIVNNLPRTNRNRQFEITRENDPDTTYAVRPISGYSMPSAGGVLAQGYHQSTITQLFQISDAGCADLYSRIQVG